MRSNKACPNHCEANMEFIGAAGILDYDSRWEAETERYRCRSCGCMIFIVPTVTAALIDEAEAAAVEEAMAAEALTTPCEECGAEIPDLRSNLRRRNTPDGLGGSLENKHHKDFCSLFNPKND